MEAWTSDFFFQFLSFAFFILSCEIDTNITTFIDSLTSEMFFATCLAFPLSREETLTKAAASVGWNPPHPSGTTVGCSVSLLSWFDYTQSHLIEQEVKMFRPKIKNYGMMLMRLWLMFLYMYHMTTLYLRLLFFWYTIRLTLLAPFEIYILAEADRQC